MADVLRVTEMYGKGYGMPSSHAQFVSFFAIYLFLFLLSRHKPAWRRSQTVLHAFERVLTVLVLGVGCVVVSASRIYLNYHTQRQVLAGCAVGSLCAFGWFFVIDFLRNAGWIDQVLDLPAARYARARDMLRTEDLAEPGWQRWKQVRELRRQIQHENSEIKSD